MVNVFLELQRLQHTLEAKGMDPENIAIIVQRAESEINSSLSEIMTAGLDQAVGIGVQKNSAEFINELRPRPDAFELETSSGRTDFSEPPFPMLDKLLQNAKPMQDGSGVYKVIPVGKPGNRPPIHLNIMDAQKAIMAERHREAINQYKAIAPKSSKFGFRTATSKQNRDTQWVMPAQEKSFGEELTAINDSMQDSARDAILGIIQSYEDML